MAGQQKLFDFDEPFRLRSAPGEPLTRLLNILTISKQFGVQLSCAVPKWFGGLKNDNLSRSLGRLRPRARSLATALAGASIVLILAL